MVVIYMIICTSNLVINMFKLNIEIISKCRQCFFVA